MCDFLEMESCVLGPRLLQAPKRLNNVYSVNPNLQSKHTRATLCRLTCTFHKDGKMLRRLSTIRFETVKVTAFRVGGPQTQIGVYTYIRGLRGLTLQITRPETNGVFTSKLYFNVETSLLWTEQVFYGGHCFLFSPFKPSVDHQFQLSWEIFLFSIYFHSSIICTYLLSWVHRLWLVLEVLGKS